MQIRLYFFMWEEGGTLLRELYREAGHFTTCTSRCFAGTRHRQSLRVPTLSSIHDHGDPGFSISVLHGFISYVHTLKTPMKRNIKYPKYPDKKEKNNNAWTIMKREVRRDCEAMLSTNIPLDRAL